MIYGYLGTAREINLSFGGMEHSKQIRTTQIKDTELVCLFTEDKSE